MEKMDLSIVVCASGISDFVARHDHLFVLRAPWAFQILSELVNLSIVVFIFLSDRYTFLFPCLLVIFQVL